MAYMNLNELIRLLLDGERDFSGIILKRTDLSGHPQYGELQGYLKQQDFSASPVIFNGSDLSNLVALGLYLPYAKCIGTILKDAELQGTNLEHAIFRGANIIRVNFSGNAQLTDANFTEAFCHGMILDERPSFRGADFYGAHVDGDNILRLYMAGANNLDRIRRPAKNPGRARSSISYMA